MSDLIDRQAAIDFINAGSLCNPNEPRWSDNDVVIFLRSRPSAQPELIRCKDCKHYNAGFECLIEGYGIERDKDWFCGDAERREEDD